MAEPIEIVRLAPQRVLVVRKTVPRSGVGEFLMATYPRLISEILAQGATIASMAFARFYERGPTAFDVEAGLAFSGAVGAPSWAQVTELPGGEAARTVHVGPRETLSMEYPRLERWLAEHGKAVGVGPWVIFIDNDDVTSQERLRTEVYWPVDDGDAPKVN